MLGRKTLLINPPLINGVAFTRQGRCQEREEVLGTTKPPYTLALLATLLKEVGCETRLIDATADRLSIEQVIERLDARGLLPNADPVPQHDTDARCGRRRHRATQTALQGPDVLLRAARLHRADAVDGTRA